MLAMASARAALRARSPVCRRAFSLPAKPQTSALSRVLEVSEEVQEALYGSRKKPVVALETTIYTHGFPYPDNVALASHLESVVRTMGGVPATIAILDGVARVGMDPEELIRIAASAGKEGTLKISRRDLAYACGLRLTGADNAKFTGGTTIAGTMILAHLAGIKVFATGGLGGVHRGAESTMDISADLTELGRTPVAVISSGCKSFLDIPRTLEYLETQGVPVTTFADGRNGRVDFPGFWSRESGSPSPQVLQDEKQAAAMIYAQNAFPLATGLLMANPIPTSASIPKSEIDTIIKDAVEEANVLGITGAKNTPFILAKIKELTGGKSVTANRALISSNVARGTNVAKELLALEESLKGESKPSKSINIPVDSSAVSSSSSSSSSAAAVSEAPPTTKTTDAKPPQAETPAAQENVDVVVAGALAIDFACNYVPPPNAAPNTPVALSPKPHTSNRASITQTLGGVAHNIALAARLSGSGVRLASAIGDDAMGRVALDLLQRDSKLDAGSVVVRPGAHTGQYVAVNDARRDLALGLADMDIIQDTPAPAAGQDIGSAFNADLAALRPAWLVADANWSPATLRAWLRAGRAAGARTLFEPVSGVKAARLFEGLSAKPQDQHDVLYPRPLADLATPNALELAAMWAAARERDLFASPAYWALTNAYNLPQGGASALLAQATSAQLVAQGVPQQALQLLPLVPCLAVTLGAEGVLVARMVGVEDGDGLRSPHVLSRSGFTREDVSAGKAPVGGVYLRLLRPEMVLSGEEVVSVNGAGDTFAGVLVSALARGVGLEEGVRVAMGAAALTLRSVRAVGEGVGELGLGLGKR